MADAGQETFDAGQFLSNAAKYAAEAVGDAPETIGTTFKVACYALAGKMLVLNTVIDVTMNGESWDQALLSQVAGMAAGAA